MKVTITVRTPNLDGEWVEIERRVMENETPMLVVVGTADKQWIMEVEREE